jgi:tetratricopeptide (TPR) repeat protein
LASVASHPTAIAAQPPAAPASSIIVAQFDNKTGDAVFDSVLTPAFTIQLQQSPVLNIVSGEHLRQSMQYLGKPASAPLTPEDAKEIGVREGIKAYLTGTISKLGNSYFLNVSAINTANGDSIASAEAEAADKEHVLSALSSVATTIRNKLGESLASIQKLDTPLGQATTPSLEAFRAFALGDVEHDQGRDVPNAEGHYKQALEIDPNFAMAWARLGAVYNNTGQNGRAVECFTKAFQLSKNVSERERFYISSFYYTEVLGDLQKSIDILELACKTYPLEKGFYADLFIAQNNMGRMEDALNSSLKALAISPDSAISNINVLFSLEELDRFAEAFREATELQKLGLNDTSDMSNLYYLHFLTGDTAGMSRDLAIVQGRTDENVMLYAVATCAEFAGEYRLADQTWKQSREHCRQREAKDAEATTILLRDSGRALAGLPFDAVGDIKTALALDQSKGTLENVIVLAALAHHPELGRPIMDKLTATYPKDLILNFVFIPSCHAAGDLAEHQPRRVLEDLEGTEPYDLISFCPYLRGLADLDLHDGAGAVAAFQKATRYRGAALLNSVQDYGQAMLGLARAYIMAGDPASAKKTYESLFTLWKRADADLPQLVAARQEYAALK